MKSMKNKTKTIDIFGSKYKIEYVDTITDEDNNTYWGMAYHDTRLIQIATKYPNGTSVTEEEMKITLLHELLHAFLASGEFHSECEDEHLVEWLARCINAAQKQKII